MNPTSKGCWQTVTALPTDRRQPDFLEGAQFAVYPYVAVALELRQKEKRNGLRMKHQCLTSSVSRFSILSDFPYSYDLSKFFGLNTLKPV
ncbi:hypothetical protein HCG96_02770 [Bacteroides xylanisolvens]|nr:hypothetical protein [Bacteroides xylanisolvens]